MNRQADHQASGDPEPDLDLQPTLRLRVGAGWIEWPSQFVDTIASARRGSGRRRGPLSWLTARQRHIFCQPGDISSVSPAQKGKHER